MAQRDRHVEADDIQAAEHDPSRDVDVLAVHRQAFREPIDPAEGTEAGPWWFWACAVAALVFGGFYMGRYTGVFAGSEAVHTPVGPRQMMRVIREGAPGPARPQRVDGAAVYGSTCVACHQADGRGTPGLFPPLAGSEWVTEDAALLIRIALHGLTGPISVSGTAFSGAMPPWKQLSDEELAAVLTYVRESWGNAAAAVTVEDVAREREATRDRPGPWTAAELIP
jgi:mono/diheme cytochrome c family protein